MFLTEEAEAAAKGLALAFPPMVEAMIAKGWAPASAFDAAMAKLARVGTRDEYTIITVTTAVSLIADTDWRTAELLDWWNAKWPYAERMLVDGHQQGLALASIAGRAAISAPFSAARAINDFHKMTVQNAGLPQ